MKLSVVAIISVLMSINLSVACTGIQFKASWTEPTTSADGTPLTGLAKTTLYYQVNALGPKSKIYTAKSPTGGAARTATITVPVKCEAVGGNTVKFWVTATDTSGNESVPSNIVVKQTPQML